MPPKLKQGAVPLEIKQRLDNNEVLRKRIEHSRYGAIDRLLNIIFWQRKWMIKPQAPVFEEASTLEEEEPDTSMDIGNTSRTSYGKVKAKGARATHPDFLVCTFTPTALDDVPALVVEVKPEGMSQERAVNQLASYVQDLWGNIPGFLIVGNMVGELVLKGSLNEKGKYVDENKLKPKMKITSRRFLTYLRGCAAD